MTSIALLQGEDEFRDKLSPIYISLNFSLDPLAPVDQHGLSPILNYQTEQLIQQRVCTLSHNENYLNSKKGYVRLCHIDAVLHSNSEVKSSLFKQANTLQFMPSFNPNLFLRVCLAFCLSLRRLQGLINPEMIYH